VRATDFLGRLLTVRCPASTKVKRSFREWLECSDQIDVCVASFTTATQRAFFACEGLDLTCCVARRSG
jgi:hypothetical protein